MITVSASLTCQQDAQAQQSSPTAAGDLHSRDGASAAHESDRQTRHAPTGRAALTQLPALRLLADDAAQTIGQDVTADTTERATQTAAASALSNQTMPQLRTAREPVADDQPLRGPSHHRHGIRTLASVIGSAPHSAQQQGAPHRAALHAKPAPGPKSGHLSPSTVQHMSLPRPPPVRTQRHIQPRAPAQLLRPQLEEHTAHAMMASPRGWHQQWRVAAYAQHPQRAPSSRGHGDHLAEAVAAEYDALERHMDAAHLRQNRRAVRRRGLDRISEGSASRPRSPGSTVRAAQQRRQRPQQPSIAPSPRQLARPRELAGHPEAGPDSPQTSARHSHVHGLPQPARAGPGRVPQPSAADAFITASARGSVQHSESQTDNLPSPVAAAGLSMLQPHREGRQGTDSMLYQLHSVYQLADAIAERLGNRLADHTADKLNASVGAGRSSADSTGSPARSQERSPRPPRPRSPVLEVQQHGSVPATTAETKHDHAAAETDSAAPTGQSLDAAELRSALTRLCDVATAHGCVPLEPSGAVEEVPSLAWNGLVELTRIWGSFAGSLPHIAVNGHPRAAGDDAGGVNAEHPAESAQPRSRQHKQEIGAKFTAVQQPSEGTLAVPPTAQARDSADANAKERSQGAAEAAQPRDTALQTQLPSPSETAIEAVHAPALRLLRAPAEVVPPNSDRTGADAAADVAVVNEVCPRCRKQRVPGRKPEHGKDPVHAGVSARSGGASKWELHGRSAELTATEGACLVSRSLSEYYSDGSAPHSEHEAALYQPVASASSDSDENTNGKSGRLSQPDSPLSAVSAADAQTKALLATHDLFMPLSEEAQLVSLLTP